MICPNDAVIEDLKNDLSVFGYAHSLRILPSYDVSPYSGIFPNQKTLASRLGWLAAASQAAPGDLFLASVNSISQKTLPLDAFLALSKTIRAGDAIPNQFHRVLLSIGYQDSPRVEDIGHFAIRGGIIDIFSPAHELPVRIELFGDTIESLRFFDPESQRSSGPCGELIICPSREVLFSDENRQQISQYLLASAEARGVKGREFDSVLQDISLGRYFPGAEFLIKSFYETLSAPLDFFAKPPVVWILDELECQKSLDDLADQLKSDYRSSKDSIIHPEPEDLFSLSSLPTRAQTIISLLRVKIDDLPDEEQTDEIVYSSAKNLDFRNSVRGKSDRGEDYVLEASQRILKFKEQGLAVVVSVSTKSQAQRVSFLLEKAGVRSEIAEKEIINWFSWRGALSSDPNLIGIIPRPLSDSVRLPEEGFVFLNEDDFFTKTEMRRERRKKSSPAATKDLDFGDIKVGDYIVHIQHGVGIFDGLKVMTVQGVPAEFIQLTYKDNDRLYLPVYRVGQIQKFSGVPTLDKLGTNSWQRTKIKVRNHLRDLAAELLRLYAQRSQITRPAFSEPSPNYRRFESLFPYDETDDQLNAIDDVLSDLTDTKPMDRLVCGDVGFGKTEVALRAAYKVAEDGKQAAILVPTTVLAFQHLETFRKRFKGTPFTLAGFSRFTPRAEMKESIQKLKRGEISIAIGTHRLLSKDIEFKDLGLLIVDEEQKFGVAHKEKIRKLKTHVDTLAMSATPIPRTLNLSLVGIRDLSLINTPPRDRLPIRTYICKFEPETVRRAILSEINRGGQTYYIHNRVQSIYGLADELRALVPEARVRVAHGQMEEGALEETMIAFFNHEFDVLLCTTIIESGVDIARANTMIVDRSDTFGLSQLYQLRGRIGRSKDRAYCYLLVPKSGVIDPEAQERLRVLQENTTLGSGFRIAHHDLELRGAGNILGEEQSGHINAVGYELYLDLLEEALKDVRGEPTEDREVEPEINLKVPALIPDAYIPDIRIRLSYYKQLSQIRQIQDIDEIETDLRDQFGPPPDSVMNLLGLMIIRRQCKDLGVRDISAGQKTISLAFTEKTRVRPQVVIDLALREKRKYSLTPDSRLIVKMETPGWPEIYEELEKIKKLARI